jgi:ABC-type transporter lipoprotein component MlaA/pimeloyl-ACP methyl ester carboxylesterase
MKTRLTMTFRNVLILTLCCALVFPSVLYAAKKDPQRELSNVSVIGVEKFEEPTQHHQQNFEMIQYLPDPIEGFNRGSLGFTKGFIDWFFKPLTKGWRFVTPTGFRKSLSKFHYNISYPVRLVSLLLQAEGVKAGKETGRFLVNTTVGIVGLFDPATRWGMPTYREDVGLAFARWGNGPGFYLVIPFMGPSSGRDGLGRIFDTALTPTTYLFGANLFFNMNAFTFKVDGYEALVESEPNIYLPVRALWGIQRAIAVSHYKIPDEDYVTADPDPTLGSLLVKVEDPKFPTRARVRSVKIPTTNRKLPYSLWLQKERAPLVFIVPGIGTHRNSTLPVSLAETAFNRGYSVVTISNPFHPEFIQNALSIPYPGYTPRDAEDVYTALTEIARDIKTRHPMQVSSVKLMGYSLGAIETLFIAGAQDDRPSDALRFDKFVAINPPVDVRYAAGQFDGYFDAPLSWPEAERDQRIKELAMKVFLVAQEAGKEKEEKDKKEQDMPEKKKLPVTRSESEFLIGFAGRTMLAGALKAIEAKGDPVLEIPKETEEGRGLLLGVINQSNFDRYGSELVIPYYLENRERGVTREQITFEASLRNQEKLLSSSDKVRIFTNVDDFILGEENLSWLRETAGDRLTVFPGGGHLGNLYIPAVRNAIFDAL